MKFETFKNNKWSIFFCSSMANIVTGFSANSFALALPTIAKEFNTTQSNVSWIVLAYTLIPVCFLLFFGRLAEIYGYRKQFVFGYSFFGLACVLAPIICNSVPVMIVMRAFQAFGFAALVSITQAVVCRAFPKEERGKAVGMNVMFVSIGNALGPTVGGVLLAHFSWRAIFLFNVPFCIFGAVMSLLIMPKDEVPQEKPKIDFLGVLLFTGFAGPLAFSLNASKVAALKSLNPTWFMVASVIFLGLFIWREKKAESPMLALSLFKNRAYTQSDLAMTAMYLGHQMTVYLMPFYLADIVGLNSTQSGVIVLANALGIAIFSPFAGSLKDKYGTKLPCLIGLGAMVVGLFTLSRLNASSPYWLMVLALIIAGLGNGFSSSPISSTILSSVPEGKTGVASGSLSTFRSFGQTFGVCLSTLVLESRQVVYAANSTLGKGDIYLLAQRDTYYVGIIALLIGAILVATLPKKTK